jgi:hypothetical protein
LSSSRKVNQLAGYNGQKIRELRTKMSSDWQLRICMYEFVLSPIGNRKVTQRIQKINNNETAATTTKLSKSQRRKMAHTTTTTTKTTLPLQKI